MKKTKNILAPRPNFLSEVVRWGIVQKKPLRALVDPHYLILNKLLRHY